jgi:PAS domain S-box-containing protein
MTNQHRTKTPPSDAVLELRQRVADLEASQKQSEKDLQALSREAEHWRSLVEAASDSIVTLDLQGRVTWCSANTARVTGYCEEEIIGRHLSKLPFLRAADIRAYLRIFRSTVRGRAPRPFEAVWHDRDNNLHWSIVKLALMSEGDRAVGIQAIVTESTGRKLADNALRKNEEKYRELVDNMDDVIYCVDGEGTISYVSPALESALGYAPDQVIGHHFVEFIHQDDQARIVQSFERLLAGHRAEPTDYRMLTRSGQIRWTRASSRLIRAPDGAMEVRGVLSDITERRRADQALRESEEKYRNLVERANDGIVIIQAGKVRFANQRLAELWGGPAEDILGTPFTDYVHPDALSAVADRYRRRMAGEDVAPIYQTILKRKDGSRLYAELNAGLISYEGNPADLVLVRNTSDRKRAEDELRESYERSERTLEQTVNALAAAVETRDVYTAGHQRRVAQLACTVAEEMGVSEGQIRGLRMAGLVHDVGKMYVPGEILSRPTRLTEPEFAMVKIHPQAGYDILKTIEFPWPVAKIVLQHHERIDGSGYPQGLLGEEILLQARILAVADVVEAMLSHRPYRPAHTLREALDEISRNAGRLYDPVVAATCLRLCDKGLPRLE